MLSCQQLNWWFDPERKKEFLSHDGSTALSEKYNARHWVMRRNKDPGPLLDVQLPERQSGKSYFRTTGTTNEKISIGGTFLHVFWRLRRIERRRQAYKQSMCCWEWDEKQRDRSTRVASPALVTSIRKQTRWCQVPQWVWTYFWYSSGILV